MSEVAGKIATQAGAFVLGRAIGGRGVLLGGVPGVSPATVLVIGGGVVGLNAATIAVGMRAKVYVLERSRRADARAGGRSSAAHARRSTRPTLEIEELCRAPTS